MELIAIQVLPWETISNEFQIAKQMSNQGNWSGKHRCISELKMNTIDTSLLCQKDSSIC